MKSILYTLIFALASLSVAAQVPQLINYQAVARNSQGNVLANQAVGVRIIIHDATPVGTSLYSETHTDTTNQFGLFTLQIGNGSNQTGTFSSIDWSTGNKYLEVDIDPAGGTSYASAGTSQLLSVPYALQAQSAASVSGTANYLPKFTSASGLGNSQVFESSPYVGIGTTSPTASLHLFAIADTFHPGLLVEQNSADQAILRMTNNVANSAWDIRADNSMLAFYNNGGDRKVDIDANGAMEVGYDHGGFLNGKFKVYGSNYMGIYCTNNGEYGVYGGASNSDAANASYLYGVDGTAIGQTNDHCYGVYGNYYGNASLSYAGYFSGSVYTTGSYLPSDEKLKRNIGEINTPLSTIMALHPASYTYRTDEFKNMNLPEGNQYGFIAGELEKVIPTAVRETTQPADVDHKTRKVITPALTFKAVNYNQIIPLLVGGMQQQNQTITELKETVELLKKQNELLQQQVDGLKK